MKFKTIKIRNISSYADEFTFDLTVCEDKSIVLIGGQNGTGKTSLFTALKLALYGHLCFNYQSINTQYLAKIKGLINQDAFTSTNVNAFVEVEIEIPNEREFVSYTIKRSWSYINNKLNEELTIFSLGFQLGTSDQVFFQNYLFTILPPNLFDFFFFDGEQIADFFATSNYNNYVKNALLTLCSFDTFEIIRKFTDGYVNLNDNNCESEELKIKYENIVNIIDSLENAALNRNNLSNELESNLVEILNEKVALENNFKNSGGLTQIEKEVMSRQSKEYERIKSECNLRIKNFVENMMPFLITKKNSYAIREQLDKEIEIKKYFALQDKLSSPEVSKAVKEIVMSYGINSSNYQFIDELLKAITQAVKPAVNVDDFIFLHDLSKEQLEIVNNVTKHVEKFSNESIFKDIDEKEQATKRNNTINKKLRDAMADSDVTIFSQNLRNLSKLEFDIQRQLEDITEEKITDEQLLNFKIIEKSNIFESMKDNAKNKNIYELTSKISQLMGRMIDELSANKFKQIESIMLSILNKIMSKDNFIDLVELDNNFNINLYKQQTYKMSELENLIINLGHDELAKRIGNKGVKQVLEAFDIDSFSKLKNNLNKSSDQINLFSGTTIDLYKKIEFSQLSKGEKQIFILSLYYAIIKVSGKDIPFIIDTPYARIDTEHREQISKEFFPKVSSQVIIFSTDEEISATYYGVLKPFIDKEYLLQYDEKNSKTTVMQGYFFKEINYDF
jgi:DNA sulfur modification protein DndD